MTVSCRKITFEMEEDGAVWDSVLSMENVVDMSIEHAFLPETSGEEIVIRIVQRTEQSRKYAAYVSSIARYAFK